MTRDNNKEELAKQRLSISTANAISLDLLVIQPIDSCHAVCCFCGRESENIAARRLNTAYVDEPSNWLCSCYDCYSETVDHYKELWYEYCRSQGV